MNTTIKLFEKYAHKYDEMQPVIVPYYENVIAMVAEAYHHYIGKGNFMDLGCGTGNVSLNILKQSPKSRVFLLDGSPSMLKIAVDKIQNQFGDNSIIGSKAINLEEEKWYQGVDGHFDAVVTAFVLEHLKEPDYKAVVKKCCEFLRPGGVFISVEWGDNENGLQDWFWKKMEKMGERQPQYKHIIEEASTAEKHYFVNINKKMEWIRGADYKEVYIIWQNLFGYVIISEK